MFKTSGKRKPIKGDQTTYVAFIIKKIVLHSRGVTPGIKDKTAVYDK